VAVLEECIKPATLDGVQIYFPDPWHKKRHHKRRLIQPAFVTLVCSRLAPGGYLHLATDWQNYAEHMLEVLSGEAGLVNRAGAGNYAARPAWRPETRFEQRGQRLGHEVRDLLFERHAAPQ
jgi:tRNA (guanine-N7-)-methyltransferase